MPRTSSRKERERARAVFNSALRGSGDYRTACRVAGVSERSGRRWKRELEGATQVEVVLPVPFTSFVGREKELARLEQLYRARRRLVTLVGPPGVGKTRLAVQWLQQRSEKTESQPRFVDLRGCRDARSLTTGVGRTLGVQLDAADAGGAELLGHVFRAYGPILVVLDNFDELVAEGTESVRQWLRAAPELQMIVTSREILAVDGELVFEVPPFLSRRVPGRFYPMASPSLRRCSYFSIALLPPFHRGQP